MKEKKKVRLALYKGSYTINFNDEDEYNEFLNEKTKHCIIVGITILLFILLIVFILIALGTSKFNVFAIYILIALFVSRNIYYIIEKRYNNYKFDAITRDIKRNKYKISYSNNSTGHITYIKDGVGYSIYVFKGKGAKGA